MRLFPRKNRIYSRAIRLADLVAIVAFAYTLFLPQVQLLAQEYKRFDRSQGRLESYTDRATRMENEASWTNYMDLGIASERAQWEQEAFEQLQQRVTEIQESEVDDAEKESEIARAQAELQAAAEAWNEAAEEFKQEERGEFRAEKTDLEVGEIDESFYQEMIARAEAAVAGQAAVDLDGWEAAIATDHAAIVQSFEDELANELGRARAENAGLTGTELAAFENELSEIEGEIRREFEVRDRFFVTRARNRYIALKRGDDLNARLASEESSATNVTENVIENTLSKLEVETSNMLDVALEETENLTRSPDTPDFEAAGTNWEARMESVISAGLRSWEQAEEDLYARRLAWQQEQKRSREEATKVWEASHEEIKRARDEWLSEIQVQIKEGREQWQSKIAEFRENREAAEQEMAEYIAAERERWNASSKELASIVNGGGGALLETKDAFRYYDDLLKAMPGGGSHRDQTIRQFYSDQRDYMQGAVQRFQGILASAEGVLNANMHSGADHTGLLNDVRIFAGDLPDRLKALDAAGFEDGLRAEMNSRSEDFVLYRRDMEDLIDRNAVFSSRAADLESSDEFDYQAVADLNELAELVDKLERKYDEHKAEIAAIVNEPREGLDDAQRLNAIKDDLDQWTRHSTNKDERLKKQAVDYFNAGLGGYYLTGNEGDPYLMTRAEYEWELLRRERNYLTKKLRRAEAVKDYADRAFQHDAGLEMAAVTAERQSVALTHRDLREIAYQLIRGEVDLDPLVYKVSPDGAAMVESELDRLLGERGIDRAELASREATLDTELAILDDLLAFSPASRDDAEDLVNRIDTYLTEDLEITDPEKWGEHQLGIVREKLITFRDRLDAGASADEQTNSWSAIVGGADVLRGEIQNLKDDYDFAGLNAQIQSVRALITRPNLTMIRGDLADIKDDIQANEAILAEAAEQLELAKDAYRQARIDYDVMRANNSEDLIRIDINNTTGALGRVIHQMTQLEDVPGFDSVYDPVTAGRIEYLNEISQRETAQADLTGSEDALLMVRNLESSKERLVNLESLLDANTDLESKTAEDLADLFINAKDDLVTSGEIEAALNSSAEAVQAIENLAQIRAGFEAARKSLADATAAGNADQIELARAAVAGLESATRRTVEKLVAAIRAEERSRRDAFFFFLDTRDGGGDPVVSMETLVEKAREDDEKLNTHVFEQAQASAEYIAHFMNTNMKDGAGNPRSFTELLKLTNDQVDILATRVRLSDGYGFDRPSALLMNDRLHAENLRSWLVENREAIMAASAAPDEFDPRTTDEKVAAILENAQQLADDSKIYGEVQASIPDSASHTWVVNYRSDRESLLSELEGVLATGDAGLATAYAALPDARRQLIESYGALDSTYLRDSLKIAANSLKSDLADLDSNFAAIYMRETRAAQMNRMAEIQQQLGPVQGSYNAALIEQSAHKSERARLDALLADETDPAEQSRLSANIADLDGRIAELQTTIDASRPTIESLTDELRDLSARAQEASKPGSSSKLANKIMASLALEGQSITALEQAAQGLLPEARAREVEKVELSAGDQVKVALGFYQTDANGMILKDGAGDPLVSQEFIDLGITDPAADLGDVLSGDQSGSNLMRWAERLSAFSRDDANRQGVPAEVLAAMDMLEDGIREVLAAQAFIENRYETKGNLSTSAAERRRVAQEGLKKLGKVLELQTSLEKTIQEAAQQGKDPVDAALALLENPTNARLLRVYAGYDEEGNPDGAVDPISQQRQDELIKLAERLRENRLNSHLVEVRAAYDQMIGDWVAFARAEPLALAPDRQAFLDGRSELKVEPVKTALDALAGDDGFRAAAWEWAETAPTENRFYRGRVIEILTNSVAEGQDLKDEIAAALDGMQTDIMAGLDVAFGETERKGHRDANLVVTTSVENLMTAYATRGTLTRDTILPELEALDDLGDFDDAKATIRAKMAELAALQNGEVGPATLELRRAMLEIIGEAGDTVQLKSNLRVYLNGLSDPAAGEIEQLREEVALSSLQESLATMSASPTYDAGAYPEELREFILTSAYQNAAARFDAYRQGRDSNLAGERDAAVFDLSGMNGDLANHFLVSDFAEYSAANDPAAAAAAAVPAGSMTIDTYLQGYLTDRNGSAELLPAGGAAIVERLALQEYARLQADIAANGIAAVDERNYFADFREIILVQKAQDYVNRNGISIAGATVEERAADLEGHMEAMLRDPAYTLGGKTLGQRVLLRADRDQLMGNAYGLLEYGPQIESYLPPQLDLARAENRLNDAPRSAADFLPDDLTAVADYATRDLGGLLSATDEATRASFARQKVLAEAFKEEDFSLTRLSDAQLGAIADRAGYDTAGASLRDELVTYLRNQNIVQMAGGAASAGEAVLGLRQAKIIENLVGDSAAEAALGDFMTAEGSRLERIEAKFMTALAGRHADLQRATKEERGNILRAVIERAGGGTTPFYDGLSADLQTEVDALKDELFGTGDDALSTAEQNALESESANYQLAFDLRSATELVSSGLFEAVEGAALAALDRTATDVLGQAGRADRPGLTGALLDAFYVNRGDRAAVSAKTRAFFDATPGMEAALTRAAAELPEALGETLANESVLVDRFLNQYQESQAERAELDAIYQDPTVLQPESSGMLGFEAARDRALIQSSAQELTTALVTSVQNHREYFQGLSLDYEREVAVSTELQKFANLVRNGDQFQESRYSTFRTFIGVETKYQKGDVGEAEKQGAVLNTTSLGQNDPEGLLNSDNWADVLRSDGGNHYKEVTNADGDTVRLRSVYSVSDPGARNFGGDYERELRHTYFEHIANNYLDKISKLQGALNSVFIGSEMAEKRKAASTTDFKQELRDKYDPNAATNDVSFLETKRTDANSRLAIHSEEAVRKLQGKITGLSGQYDSAANEFAQAARRDQISTMPLEKFINTVFKGDENNIGLEQELRNAEARHTALSNESERLRGILDGKNRELAGTLRNMADNWSQYERANDEYEERAQVAEYAQTPYLFASQEDSEGDEQSDLIEEYRGDALEEYDLARRAVDYIEAQLKEAAYEVYVQDDLAEFNEIVAGIEGGQSYDELTDDETKRMLELRDRKFRDYETLTPAEEAELTALDRREMYQRYKDVISTRAEHIKHSMRMVRLHKANELIQGEVMRRRAVADEKEKQFRQTLSQEFGQWEGDEQLTEARNGVYARLAGMVEGGAVSNIFNEFRSWYWGGNNFAKDAFGSYVGASQQALKLVQAPKFWPTQIMEGALGLAGASMMNGRDRHAIGLWMGAGGSIAEFSQFQGVYFAAVNQMGVRDQMKLKFRIVHTIWSPGLSHPYTNRTARAKIDQAKMEWDVAQQNMWLLYGLAASTASTHSIRRVMATQAEYEDALAALYYFTRIPDQQTLKERMIGYGANQSDDPNDHPGGGAPALYKLTEEDLVYIFDKDANGNAQYLNSVGGDNNPSDEIKNESLDITGIRDQVEYRDAFDRRYDPKSLRDSSPGNLQGGYYWNGDERWTRIRFFRHDGSTYFRYARIIDEDADLHEVYNMEDVLKATVPHGQAIRDDRFKKYNEAGNAVSAALQDQTFILNERDQTYENLFNQAAGHVEGGREFTGYRMTYEDYRKNADAVFGNELTQREKVQLKEWELREKELVDRYNEWEARVQTILDRGAKSWAGSEDRFLQRWREWEREFDRNAAEGKKKWDEEIAAHFTNKKNWEEETRARASEATIEKVLGDQIDALNRQLRASSRRMGEATDTMNRTAMIQDAIQQMRREMPKGGAKLKSINANIKNFSTKISTAEMVKGNFQNTANSLAATFRAEMKEHQHRMKVLANVKIFEQYRQMIENFKKQIEVQNRQIANSTAAAAMAQGYIKMGDVFVKKGLSSSAMGFVNAYKYFDVESAMERKLKSFGFTPMGGDELVSFLDGKSNVEVEAYFYTQKLAVSAAIEEIQGRGSEAERASSRDAAVIGEFSAWVGSPSQDKFHGHADTLAGGSFGGPSETRSMAFDMAQAGFGELGAMGTRPGGAPAGFYVQLKYMGQHVAKADAEGVAKAGEVDPLTNTLNAFNPLVMVMSAVENVEVGSKVYGRDRGKLIEAQAINMGKQALISGGQIMMTAGNAILPGAAIAVGAAMIAAGNAIQVNPTTGERAFKMTDQAAITAATQIAGGLVPGLGEVSQLLATGVQAGISVLNAGMEYDEKGQSQGWKMTEKKFKDNAISMGVSAIGAGLGAELGGAMGGGQFATAFAGVAGSTFANEVYAYSQGDRGLRNLDSAISTWGSVANSYVASMNEEHKYNNDPANKGKAPWEFKSGTAGFGVGERFLAGAVGSIAGSVAPFAKLGLMAYEGLTDKKILAPSPADAKNKEETDSDNANKGNQARRFTEIFQGYGAAREEQFGLGKRLLMHGAGAIGIDTDKLGNYLLNEDKARGITGGEWKSTADLTQGRFETERTNIIAEFDKIIEGGKNLNRTSGKEFVRKLREHATKMEDYGMDVSKIRAQANSIERALNRPPVSRTAKKAKTATTGPVTTVSEQPKKEESLTTRFLKGADSLLGTNLNERVDNAVEVWNNRTSGGDGEHLFIRDDLINGLGGMADALSGGATNFRDVGNLAYNNLPGVQSFDRQITPGVHQAMADVQQAYNWTENRLQNMDWADAGWNALRMVGGAIQMKAGAAMVSAGVGMSATGIGAIAGVPLAILGGAAFANGAADVALGGANIYNNFMGNEERFGGNIEEVYKGVTGASAENVPTWVKGADIAMGMVGNVTGMARGALAGGIRLARNGSRMLRGATAFVKGGGLRNAMTAMGGKISGAMGAVRSTVTAAGKSLDNGVHAVLQPIAGAAYYGTKAAVNLGGKVINAGINAGKSAMNKISTKIDDAMVYMGDKIADARAAGRQMMDNARDVWKGATASAGAAWDTAVTGAKAAGDAMMRGAETVADFARSKGRTAFKYAFKTRQGYENMVAAGINTTGHLLTSDDVRWDNTLMAVVSGYGFGAVGGLAGKQVNNRVGQTLLGGLYGATVDAAAQGFEYMASGKPISGEDFLQRSLINGGAGTAIGNALNTPYKIGGKYNGIKGTALGLTFSGSFGASMLAGNLTNGEAQIPSWIREQFRSSASN